MKRILALLLMAAALCVSPFGAAVQAKDSSSTIEDVVKRGTLRVGFSSFVPWAMQDKEGKYIGFEIDVATRLAGIWASSSNWSPPTGTVLSRPCCPASST